jgi:ATP-dependent Clp protease ATP-binding subunit ClpB
MEINSKPEELDVLDRKVMQLEIDWSYKREKDETKLKTLGMDLILKKIETKSMLNGSQRKMLSIIYKR